MSASDYTTKGLDIADYIGIATWLKEQGVDLIDVSSGAVVQAKINTFPGYQVTFAEKIKEGAGIQTAAVGLIVSGVQAEEILQNQRADLIFIGREFYGIHTSRKQLLKSSVHPSKARVNMIALGKSS